MRCQQRMNELAVKGATGTLTTSDRMTLNEELKQLQAEVTRIASDTEFNGQPLLDGTFDLRGYTDNYQVKVDYYSDDVIPKKYMIDKLDIVYNDDGTIDKDRSSVNVKYEGDYAFPVGVKFTSVGQDKVTLTGPQDFEMTLKIESKPIKDADGNVTGYASVSPLEKTDVSMDAFDVVYTPNQIPNSNPAEYTYTLDLAATRAGGLDTAIQSNQNIPKDVTVSVVSGATSDTIVLTNDSGFRMEIPVNGRPVNDNVGTTQRGAC